MKFTPLLLLAFLALNVSATTQDQVIVANTSGYFYWEVVNQTTGSTITTATCNLDIYNSTGQALFLNYPNAFDAPSNLYAAQTNNSFGLDTYSCLANCSEGGEYSWKTFPLTITKEAININITGLVMGTGSMTPSIVYENAGDIFVVTLALLMMVLAYYARTKFFMVLGGLLLLLDSLFYASKQPNVLSLQGSLGAIGMLTGLYIILTNTIFTPKQD